MMSTDKLLEQITPEQKQKLLACDSVEELIQAAQSAGVDLDIAEELYAHSEELFARLHAHSVDEAALEQVVGGKRITGAECGFCGCVGHIQSKRDFVLSEINYKCLACGATWSERVQHP